MSRRHYFCATLLSIAICGCCGPTVERLEERYPSGTTKTIRAVIRDKDGNYRRQGICTSFFENGQKAIEASFEDNVGNGPYCEWSESGAVTCRGTMRGGMRDGDFSEFYPNGKPKAKGRYREDKRQGEWNTWNQEGKLVLAGEYTDGRMTGTWKDWLRGGTEHVGSGADLEQLIRETETSLWAEAALPLVRQAATNKASMLQLLNHLENGLNSGNPGTRRAAAEIVQPLGREAASLIPTLRTLASSDECDAETRIEVSKALAAIAESGGASQAAAPKVATAAPEAQGARESSAAEPAKVSPVSSDEDADAEWLQIRNQPKSNKGRAVHWRCRFLHEVDLGKPFGSEIFTRRMYVSRARLMASGRATRDVGLDGRPEEWSRPAGDSEDIQPDDLIEVLGEFDDVTGGTLFIKPRVVRRVGYSGR